jgi:hypothetical protein
MASLPAALALVADTPSINGKSGAKSGGKFLGTWISHTDNSEAAVPYTPPTMASKKRPSDFVHPGLWHSHADLELMRTSVLAKKDPWYSAYQLFSNNTYSVSTYTMQGPKPVISRGAISNYTTFANDARAAYQNAIMCGCFPCWAAAQIAENTTKKKKKVKLTDKTLRS